MAARSFKPDNRYLIKMMVMMTLIAGIIMLGILLLSWLIGMDEPNAAPWVLLVLGGLNGLWWLVGMLFSIPYFRSLRYEVQEDEVIVQVGVITHSVKHVPYRTVTNITVKRDILDRWLFNLGSLNIQTAGMSGQTGAEESLVGLEDVQEVYELVVTALRRYRGAMAPTAAEEEAQVRPTEAGAALLQEVRAIRELIERRE
ncbi:MAG TPA: PH domain-containing protein [Anaerolineales bacterium]